MRRYRVLAAGAFLALLLSGACVQGGDRRGFAWSIGGSCGPAVPVGAALPVATVAPPATYGISTGCCGGAPAMVYQPAPVQTVYQPAPVQTVQVQQMPMVQYAAAPVYSGCCGGGAAASYAVQYVAPVAAQIAAPAQTVSLIAEAPVGITPIAQRLAVQIQQTAGCLPAGRSAYLGAEQGDPPMTNAELSRHVVEMSAILDRVTRLVADHEATLRKGSAQKPPPPMLPATPP